MRRRMHACHMRRRIHAWFQETMGIGGQEGGESHGEGQREREREKFIDNRTDDASSGWHRRWALVAQHWRRLLYPHSPFGLEARVSATHKRDQTVAGPPQSTTRSFEGSGSQTDPQTPDTTGGPGSSLSDILRISSEGQGPRT